jgi:DsbC/DsbD-like thiol-disulfide interchange protein
MKASASAGSRNSTFQYHYAIRSREACIRLYRRANNRLKDRLGGWCAALAGVGLTGALLAASSPALAVSGIDVATQHVTARLVSEVTAVAPGQSFWVALEFDIRDGWHTYWRNPGDSGLATQLAWRMPYGFTAENMQWTAPHRFDLQPLVNYGYAGHAIHLIRVSASKDSRPGSTALLSAKASWLVCSDVCIPERAQLSLKVPIGSQAGGNDPAHAALFSAARRELPIAAPGAVIARIDAGRVILRLGREWDAALSRTTSLSFFPYEDGAIDYASPQTLTRTADAVELAIKAGSRSQKLDAIRGVLIATEDSSGRTVSVPFEILANFRPERTGPVPTQSPIP